MAAASVVARDGNNAAQNMSVVLDAVNTINIPQVGLDSSQAVYRASANFTPFTTAAVTLIQVKGSSSKTVRIKRIGIGGVATAINGQVFQLIRTSATGSGGTAVTPTVSLMDRGPGANYPAGTAVVTHFTTAAQTSGTTTGFGPLTTWLQMGAVVTTPTTTGGQLQPAYPEFGVPIGSAIVLRGVTDFLEVQNVTPANLSTATVLSYFVEWVEDSS